MSELKPYSHYNDLYDKFTVQECRKVIYDTIKKEDSKDKPGERGVRTNSYELYVSFTMIDRALNKKSVIDNWIIEDQKKDKFIESVKKPKIACRSCSEHMYLDDTMLIDGYGEKEDKLLFIFLCKSCNKRRMIYNNGDEKVSEKHFCPDCNIELFKETKIKNEIYTTTYKCIDCSYSKVEKIDLSIGEEKPDLNYESDRKKFCVSEEQADKIKNCIEDFYSRAYEIMTGKDPKSIAERKEEEKYRPLKKIRIISHNELEGILGKILAQEGYTDFNLSKPDVGDDIKLYFSVLNKSGEGSTMKSNKVLRKIINEGLEQTNWLLIDQGRFENRLGVIKGRLKGIDNKNRLLELISKRQNQKKK